jgi:hypothetical protein
MRARRSAGSISRTSDADKQVPFLAAATIMIGHDRSKMIRF